MVGEMTMKLLEIVETFLPESHPYEPETWEEFITRLWVTEADYMRALRNHMIDIGGWFHNDVDVHDGHIQNGHHRLVTCMGLGWWDLDIPYKYITKEV